MLSQNNTMVGWCFLPDGREARIGDSEGIERQVSIPAGPIRHLPDNRSFLVGALNKSGYAVIRTVDPQSMIFVMGMAHSYVHKHADDLSFELYEHGRMIFIDTGKFGYFRRNKMRHYVQSATAHNTISLLKQRIGPKNVDLTGSALSDTAIEDGVFVVRGEVSRPSLFSQRREFFYDPGRFLVIRDHVQAEEKQDFVSSLHIAPDLLPVLRADGFDIELNRPDGATIGAQVSNATLDVERGRKDPLLGWYSPGYGRLEPTSTVRAHCRAKSATISWAIWFESRWRSAAIAHAAQTLVEHDDC